MPINHIGLTVLDISTSKTWYSTALSPLGYKISMELGGGHVIGFSSGKCGPDFWLASGDLKKLGKQESLDESVCFYLPRDI
jgi:hypothetical protein